MCFSVAKQSEVLAGGGEGRGGERGEGVEEGWGGGGGGGQKADFPQVSHTGRPDVIREAR